MTLKRRIYLDSAASTGPGNPSSLHAEGVKAARALKRARAAVARCLTAQPDEIIFTSSGTESNNLAIFGVARVVANVRSSTLNTLNISRKRGHIIVTVIEHASVLEPCRELEREGWRVTYLPVSPEGLVDPATVAKALRSETVLVSVMYVNNEIGAIQPIREIAKAIRHFRKTQSHTRPYFHTDGCQAARFLDLNVAHLGVDLMTLNGSKIYGPAGVGVLYVRRGVALGPLFYGGGQEGGRRSGTENVTGARAFAGALEGCADGRQLASRKLAELRDRLISGLLKIEGVRLNGPPAGSPARLPNNINVTVAGVDGEQLVIELDAEGVACSIGAACNIPESDESYVIMALGRTKEEAGSAVRFTLDRETTAADVKYVLKVFPEIVEKLRSVNKLLNAPNTESKI